MRKYVIDLNTLSLCKDPIADLIHLFGFKCKKSNLISLNQKLCNIKEDLYVEFWQSGLVSDAMMEILTFFQDLQKETKYLHLSQHVI